jgi:hypothetical protein
MFLFFTRAQFVIALWVKLSRKDLDIFAIGAVSLNHIYIHEPKIVNIICSHS